MKRWTPVLCLIAFLLLSTLLATPVPAGDWRGDVAAYPEIVEPAFSGAPLTTGQPQGQAAAPEFDPTLTSHFLPLVVNNQKNARPCSEDSPFSIQIAALHMVEEELAAAGMTEEEWRAWYDAAFPTLVDALKASGACWTRLRVDWNEIQPDPPPAAYDWSYHDEKLGLIAASGLQMIATVDNAPPWAAVSGMGPVYQDHLDDMAQFLTNVVNHYKQPPYNIHTWELFNEPDWTSRDDTWGWGRYGAQYAEMLMVANAAIKAADPGATVLMGGIAYDWFTEYNGWFYRYFPDDVMAAGGGQSIDALNLHYFPDHALEWERWTPPASPPTCGVVDDGVGAEYPAGGIDAVAKINHYRNRMEVCHGISRPVWLTETGEHGYMAEPDTLEQQARYVIQVYARAFAAGMRNVTWHAIIDPPYYPYEQGLLDSHLGPKPAFFSYQTMVRELEGYSYSYTQAAPGIEAYVFADDAGHTKIVAWAWGTPLQPAYLTMANTGQVRKADRNQNVTYVLDGGAGDADGAVNGSVVIELPAPPVDPDESDPYRFTAEPLFLSP